MLSISLTLQTSSTRYVFPLWWLAAFAIWVGIFFGLGIRLAGAA